MARTVRILLVLSMAVLITSCAAKRSQVESLSFPADLNQPFLTLEQTLGEDVKANKGLLKRLLSKITGPKTVLSPLRPVAIALSAAGDIYVVDADAAQVLCYQVDDGRLKNVTAFGSGMLKSPQGIAISKDMIYVSDSETGLIQRFDMNFKGLKPFKIEGLTHPGQIKLNPHTDELFIMETPAHRILVIDSQGQVKTMISNAEIGRNVITAPIAVDFTAEGNIVILDGMTRRVEFLSADYKYLSGFGDYDQVPGSLSYPRGLTVSSDGYIFVSDAAFGNVQIFDSRGALLYFFGETGTAAGEFLLPTALTFDAQDNLYIVDQYNSRVQIFHYDAQGE